MRSAVGGCVENILEIPRAENGDSIIIAATERSVAVGGIGFAATPCSILYSAEASANGSPVSALPSSSASYSRVREIAIWMSDAAIGARMTLSMAPTAPNAPAPLSESRFERVELPKYMSE